MSSRYYYIKHNDNEISLYERISHDNSRLISNDVSEITKIIPELLNIKKCVVQSREGSETLIIKERGGVSLHVREAASLRAREEFNELTDLIFDIANKNYVKTSTTKKKYNRKSKFNSCVIKRYLTALMGVIIISGGLTMTVINVNRMAKEKENKTPSYAIEIENKVETPNLVVDEVNDDSVIIPSGYENLVVEDIYEKRAKETEQYKEETHSSSVYVDFEDLSNAPRAIKSRDEYYDLIAKKAKKYGLDPDLVMAIAINERGSHSTVTDKGGGIGIMQMQYNVWIGKPITYYELNEKTGKFEKKKIDKITHGRLSTLETNIELGCMVLQQDLICSNYNIPMGIQMYNMGPGTINKKIEKYKAATGKDKAYILTHPEDLEWLNYRGTSRYFEHVLGWVPEDKRDFDITDVRTGEHVYFVFTNQVKEAEKVR